MRQETATVARRAVRVARRISSCMPRRHLSVRSQNLRQNRELWPGVYEVTDEQKAIRQVVETWMAASRSYNIATVLALMTNAWLS